MKCLAILILLINAGLLHAQDTDWRLWIDAGVEKKFWEKWSVSANFEYRLKNNMSTTNQIRGSVDIGYQWIKYLKLDMGYELITDRIDDGFAYRNRLIVQATGSYGYARFTASWRLRAQLTVLTNSELADQIGADKSSWVLRNLFEVKYDIPKVHLTPYVNFEIYNLLSDHESASHYKNRFGTGVRFELYQCHRFDLGYKFDDQWANYKDYKRNIINAGYVFSF